MQFPTVMPCCHDRSPSRLLSPVMLQAARDLFELAIKRDVRPATTMSRYDNKPEGVEAIVQHPIHTQQDHHSAACLCLQGIC